MECGGARRSLPASPGRTFFRRTDRGFHQSFVSSCGYGDLRGVLDAYDSGQQHRGQRSRDRVRESRDSAGREYSIHGDKPGVNVCISRAVRRPGDGNCRQIDWRHLDSIQRRRVHSDAVAGSFRATPGIFGGRGSRGARRRQIPAANRNWSGLQHAQSVVYHLRGLRDSLATQNSR